MKHSNR